MDKNTIYFHPICGNCFSVITNDIEYDNISKLISPNICPICNTPFYSIQMPTKLPYESEIDFTPKMIN